MTNVIKPWYYFACPIYVHSKQEWVKTLIKATTPFIKKARQKNASLIKQLKKDFGFSHHSTPLLEDAAFEEFQKFIGNTCAQILDSQGFDLSNHTLIFSECWVQEFALEGGGHHLTHTHTNNHMSGFYFLKSKLPEKKPEKATLASSQINFNIDPGTLIFFNSYLPHGFHVDRGIEPFRFIHWNMQAIPNFLLNNNIEKV